MAVDFSKFFLFNPFAKYFRQSRPEEEAREQEEIQNSQGISQEEIDLANFINYDYLSTPGYTMTYIGIQFEQYFASKAGRILKYRQMARYPIINDGINQICDEAIVDNADGGVLDLEINEEIPEHIEAEIRKIWNYLTVTVFRFNERGWELFRKWLVEAELYVEMVLNDKGDDIIGIKVLPAHTMTPVYDENKIKAFMQVGTNMPDEDIRRVYPDNANRGNVSYAHTQNFSQGMANNVIFDKDQVAYSNFGDFGDSLLDVRGYLDPAIRSYNQLKNMEDALVVYRLVRAPQRRVWNIYTARMPKGKADEYVRQLAFRYKKKVIYDPETGAMNSAQNVQGLTEDFWFTRDINGNGTTVDTIGGDSNFGEMDDIKYFQENLYKTMNLPKTRWDDVAADNQYTTGKSGEIAREEIKFSRMVERMQRRFKYVILDPFMTLLRLRGIDERYVDYNMYNINFTKSNLFKEYKELELLEARIAILGSVSEFIYDAEENPTGFFAKEFALRRFFLISDEDYNWNKELLEKQQQAAAPEEGEGEEAGGGGFGGGGAEEAGGFGGEEAGGGEEAAPAETPESINFKIDQIDTSILKEWNQLDESIKDRYRDKSLRNKHKKRK